ncbi:MAG: hypothetical protein ACR2OZ_04590 [Verrucomicrobiales bacterium]
MKHANGGAALSSRRDAIPGKRWGETLSSRRDVIPGKRWGETLSSRRDVMARIWADILQKCIREAAWSVTTTERRAECLEVVGSLTGVIPGSDAHATELSRVIRCHFCVTHPLVFR